LPARARRRYTGDGSIEPRRCPIRALPTAVLAVVLAAASSATAAPPGIAGSKSPACPQLANRLARLELRRPSSPSAARRLRRMRRRVADRCVAMNEIQVLGSHNSFHVQPAPDLFALLLAFSPEFFAIEYTHVPLDEQFETQGIRQIELDVFADPNGGLYARRGALIALGRDPNTGIPELLAPGLKVLHIQDVDFETTCLTFVECLRTVKRWSDDHPDHLPIMILVEAKQDPIPDPGFGFAVPIPFGPAELAAIDEEIRSVFPPQRLVTPDDVRRGRPTLEEAVLTLGWPRLGAVRGRVMFALDNGGTVKANYLAGNPTLEGRVLFTDGDPGDPDAAFIKLNDAIGGASVIPDLVQAGYVVRTRADADTVEARTGDVTTRDAALQGGAQWVSTDYPVPDPDFGTGYFVDIPGGNVARCNPINAPIGCRSSALE